MDKHIYGIKDLKAGFMEIIEGVNDGLMQRQLSTIVNDREKKTLIAQFPNDFELWHLGTLDSESGILTSDLRRVALASDWLEPNDAKILKQVA